MDLQNICIVHTTQATISLVRTICQDSIRDFLASQHDLVSKAVILPRPTANQDSDWSNLPDWFIELLTLHNAWLFYLCFTRRKRSIVCLNGFQLVAIRPRNAWQCKKSTCISPPPSLKPAMTKLKASHFRNLQDTEMENDPTRRG